MVVIKDFKRTMNVIITLNKKNSFELDATLRLCSLWDGQEQIFGPTSNE